MSYDKPSHLLHYTNAAQMQIESLALLLPLLDDDYSDIPCGDIRRQLIQDTADTFETVNAVLREAVQNQFDIDVVPLAELPVHTLCLDGLDEAYDEENEEEDDEEDDSSD